MKKIIPIIIATALCIPAMTVTAEETDVTARLEEVEAQIQELKAERRELKHKLDEQPVYENDYLRVWFDNVSDPDYTDFYSVAINFTIENKTDLSLQVSCDELSVYGFMLTDNFVSDISPYKKSRSTINLQDPSLTKDNTKDIEIRLIYRDKDTYDFINSDVFELD